MTAEDLQDAIRDLESVKNSIDPATRDRITEQAEKALGMDAKDKADLDFMLKVYESCELNQEGLFGLGLTETALRMFVEKCYADAVTSCGEPVDETSFKMALIGGLIYGKEMTERRHA
jgi:hypothetical protein